jgi:hypothetical protein
MKTVTIELTEIERRELTALVRTACVQIRIELDTPGMMEEERNQMIVLWWTQSNVLRKLTAGEILGSQVESETPKESARRKPTAIVPGNRKTPRAARTR